MRSNTEGLFDPAFLQQYAIVDNEADFESALQNGSSKITSGGIISVKSSGNKTERHGISKNSHKIGKRNKNDQGPKSNKKRKS